MHGRFGLRGWHSVPGPKRDIPWHAFIGPRAERNPLRALVTQEAASSPPPLNARRVRRCRHGALHRRSLGLFIVLIAAESAFWRMSVERAVSMRHCGLHAQGFCRCLHNSARRNRVNDARRNCRDAIGNARRQRSNAPAESALLRERHPFHCGTAVSLTETLLASLHARRACRCIHRLLDDSAQKRGHAECQGNCAPSSSSISDPP